jgi:hypothetical protein
MQAARPVVEDALHIIENQVIPRRWNRFFTFISQVKLEILWTSISEEELTSY